MLYNLRVLHGDWYMTNLQKKAGKTLCVLVIQVLVALTSMESVVAQDATPIIELVQDDLVLRSPNYSIRIYEDGLVVYRGWNYVAVEGERTDRISIEAVSQLKQSFEEANFFELRQYERNPTTGAIKFDCNEVRKLGHDNSYLTKQCQNKESIEVRQRLPADFGYGPQLGYRQGNKARQLRVYDVYFPSRLLMNLAKQIEDAVKAEKWIRPSP